MKRNKVAIKKTQWLTIYPKVGHDTLKGKPISNSVLHMGYHILTANLEHKGRDFSVDVVAGRGINLTVKDGRS